VLVFKLDDLAAIDADQVVVRRVVEVVRVVEFVVLAEVHLLEHAALHEQRERAIDGRAGDGTIHLARHFEQFLGGVVLLGAEGGLHDGVALGGPAETFLSKIGVNAFADFGWHRRTMPGACGSVKPRG